MTKKNQSGNCERRTVHEVHRHRMPGRNGIQRPPTVEAFGGLDRARLAALGYALDGPTTSGESHTGRVEVIRAIYRGTTRMHQTTVDVIDERVAFRVLNELDLPNADRLAVSMEHLQEEANRLTRLGI